MNHCPQLLRSLAALLLAVGASLPSHAGQTTIPGIMCHSDSSSVDRPTNGALLNTSQSGGTTKFHCPIVRSSSVRNIPMPIKVWIFAQTNYSTQQFDCRLRTIASDGSTYAYTDVLLPSNNSVHWVGVDSVMPANQSASAILRCDVPNSLNNTPAGILFLRVDD